METISITLNKQEAKEFELFRLCKMLANEENFEYLQHQKTRGGRLIIHLKVAEK